MNLHSYLSLFFGLLIFPMSLLAADPSLFDSSAETPHFKIQWNKAETSADEIKKFKVQIETLYKKVSKYMKAEIETDDKMTVTLNGDGTTSAGGVNAKVSYTDPATESIHLFRFSGAEFPYQNGLTRELAQGLRSDIIQKHSADKASGFGFFNDGLADFISIRTEPKSPVSSTYGAPIVVAAEHWVLLKKDIPLTALFNQSGTLDQKCATQANALRTSFIAYLDDTYGREALFKMAGFEKPISENIFKTILGMKFATLIENWKAWLKKNAALTSDFESQSQAYKKAYEAKSMAVCEPGKDF